MERHTVSRLIGAPPGYVGFDQGGLLTEAINKHPHSVLLLDEVEKAHPDVFNLLLQVMDHGTLTDNNGRKADFRHVIIVMTTNAGAFEMSRPSIGFTQQDHTSDAMEAIKRLFSPEFRNRLDAIVSFGPLSPAVMETIVEKFVLQLEAQLAERRVAIDVDVEASQAFGLPFDDRRVQRFKVGEVLEHRAHRYARFLRDRLCRRLRVARLQQRQQRVDDRGAVALTAPHPTVDQLAVARHRCRW